MYIPDYLFQNVGNPIIMGVLVYLISVADKKGNVYMSYAEIGRNLGYSRLSIYRYIKRLTDVNLVALINVNKKGVETAVKHLKNKSVPITVCNITDYKKGETLTKHNRNKFEKPKIEVKATKSAPPKTEVQGQLFEDERMNAIIEKWLAYKREKKQTYKPLGLKTLKARLITLSNNDVDMMEKIVENSMANNYAGLFPLKDEASPEQNMRNDGIILQSGQMDVTKGGW